MIIRLSAKSYRIDDVYSQVKTTILANNGVLVEHGVISDSMYIVSEIRGTPTLDLIKKILKNYSITEFELSI